MSMLGINLNFYEKFYVPNLLRKCLNQFEILLQIIVNLVYTII